MHFACCNPGCEQEIDAPPGRAERVVRCPRCGMVQPVPPGARGVSALDAPAPPRALAAECIRAIVYVGRNIRTVCGVALLLLSACILSLAFLGPLLIILRGGPGAIIVPALAAAVALTMLGYVVRLCMNVAAASLEAIGGAPELPPLNFLELLALGGRCIAVLLVYVCPVVTLPLLPLGLLALCDVNDLRACDLFWAGRAARRHPRQLATLWLFLLMWGAAMVLGPCLTVLFFLKVAEDAPRLLGGYPFGTAVAVVAAVEGGFFAVVIAFAFAIVCFRCIGVFGRLNPGILAALPQRHNPLRAAGFVLGCGALFTCWVCVVVMLA